MLRKEQFWALTAVAVLALVLVVTNALLFTSNRALRDVVNSRQQYIQQSVQLDGFYREIVRALADLSAKNNDQQLKALLNSQGITFKVTPPEAPAPGKEFASPQR